MNKNTLISLMFILIFLGGGSIFEAKTQKERANLPDFSIEEGLENRLITIQGNSVLAVSDHFSPEPKVIGKMKVVVTGYSSTTWETDDTPQITAAGTTVRDGIVANNGLPLGTKIKIPELYGDEVFVVEDRMNWKKGKYQVDIWFSSYLEAKFFGAKRTYIEILEG
jgi:3D (Asp-Asp-Asp) domain-containing protein